MRSMSPYDMTYYGSVKPTRKQLIEMLDLVGSMLDCIVKMAERRTSNCPRCKEVKQADGFSFIPLENWRFIEAMSKVQKHFLGRGRGRRSFLNRKFVDAGCGIGVKLLMAQAMGFKATGIELDPGLIKLAKTIFNIGQRRSKKTRCDWTKIIRQDIRKHNYSQYDVIYFYCPLRNTNDEEMKFEKMVYGQMKPGSYVIGAGLSHRPLGKEFVRLDHEIFWKKKKGD